MDEGTARLLLEGRPRIDKTTVARRLLTVLNEAGVPVGGFTTAELRTGGLACNHYNGTGQAAPTGSQRPRGCAGSPTTTPRRTPRRRSRPGPRHSPFALR